jgi:excisionase family DNA binding protein
MRTPKTLSDLPRYLREQYDTVAHLDRLADFYTGLEVAEIVNAAQRAALQFGAPGVADPLTTATIREGLELIGKLCAWSEPQPHALTVKQAADRLGVSARTIYDLVESGLLPCQRIGTGRGTIRVAREAIERYLDRSCAASQQRPEATTKWAL